MHPEAIGSPSETKESYSKHGGVFLQIASAFVDGLSFVLENLLAGDASSRTESGQMKLLNGWDIPSHRSALFAPSVIILALK
jgi:hypothetical protein